MIHFVVPAAQTRGIDEYLEHWGLDVASRFRVVPAESLPALTSASPGVYVLSALDQLPSKLFAFVAAFHDALDGRPDVRFLNRPATTWQRPRLLDELHRRGYNEFRAVTITADFTSLRYPVFLRDWRSHGGPISPMLHSASQVDSAIGRALVHGHEADNLLVIEFCDTADAAGYYRKYAAFVVGGEVVPRSLASSRQWMLKFGGSEFTRQMVEEENAYLAENPHEAALKEIFSLAGIEYGRIDYSMKNGRVQTWEINLNPTIGRGRRPSTGKVPPELDAIRKRGKEHFYRRFAQAWESVDLAASDGATIALDIPDSVRADALDEIRARASAPVRSDTTGWLATLRRVLRPAKPLVEPVVAPALSILGRVAQRKARQRMTPAG
jgi:hypothetical protein